MVRWQDVADGSPELAEGVRSFLDARTHKTIATVRADGSPRISGIEAFIVFRAEVTEAVLIRLSDARDKLVIESWGEGREPKRFER